MMILTHTSIDADTSNDADADADTSANKDYADALNGGHHSNTKTRDFVFTFETLTALLIRLRLVQRPFCPT